MRDVVVGKVVEVIAVNGGTLTGTVSAIDDVGFSLTTVSGESYSIHWDAIGSSLIVSGETDELFKEAA